jgi:hypothetical protein
LRAFNDLSGNSDRNVWCIGRARIDIPKMRLVGPSKSPIIAAENLASRDIAFVADPFRAAVKGTTYVFAEAWSRSAQRGRIAVFRLNVLSQVVESSIVLAEPFHLSYPCVFKQGGEYYMLPEAWESGLLILYKARTFPWDWERFRILLELDYADPQIFFHDNAWYIFLNTDPLTNANTSVFWAESLLREWHPHPQNPIFSGDPLRARSAGPLIRRRGRIFRFSQDCRQQYGHCVFASEIIELSPSSIRTIPVGLVELDRPEWARNAFHHVDVFIENGVHYALFDGYTGVIEPQAQ